MGRPDYIFCQFRETARCRDAQHGDGVCCAFAPQFVLNSIANCFSFWRIKFVVVVTVGANPICNKAMDLCFHSEKKALDMSAARGYCNNLGQSWNVKMTLPVILENFPRVLLSAYLAQTKQDKCWLDAESVAPKPGDAEWKWMGDKPLGPSCSYYMHSIQLRSDYK